ncbi:hypothetical protein DYB34_001709 [Aphanomyces astaci]|uniref:Uncharacterized protein n=1 Tax=Aphanomyces astaci TaxID=112090 RepID=A0A3R6WCZ1_APHAT|nr:hypothetical protein DYB34_001709 [Aphanomyces astaci]
MVPITAITVGGLTTHAHDHDIYVEAKKVKTTLTIEVALDDGEFINPTFRYRFLDGSKKVTPPVGTAGSWVAIAADGSVVVPAANTPAVNAASKAPSSARQGQGTVDTAEAGPKYFRHEQHIPDMEITEVFATKLNDNPIVTFFLGDQSPAPVATAVVEHNHTTTPGTGRNFITFFEVDTSPLLAGELVVEHQWGFDSAPKDMHLPLGAPMATNLPGITVQSKSLLQYITPTPHTALHKCCVPAYASLRLPQCPNRIVRTPGILQDSVVAWRHKTTFLCGSLDWPSLQETFQAGYVQVELHDRDVHVDREYSELVKKWESYVGGRVPDSSSHGADHHSTSNAKLDLFQVDDIAKQDIQHLFYVRAGDRNAHGLCTYRLYALLNTTNLKKQEPGKPFMALKFTADVVQQKRRLPPKEGSAEEINLSQVDKLVRLPGSYLNCMTSLTLEATLQFPLTGPPPSTATTQGGAFTRMVVVIPYNDVATLQNISKAMEAVNSAALPGVPLRSYQLTPAQKIACDGGDLNLVTGFQVIDSHYRMLFLEGIADAGLATMYKLVPRTAANSRTGFRMFANLDVRFIHRLYTAFDVDMKRIKLRDPLPDIAKRPELYMRSKVSENCFQALNRLGNVRAADRLLELKDLNLFPTVQMLLEVESKYGESITLEDIHGSHGSHDQAKQHVLKQLQGGSSTISATTGTASTTSHNTIETTTALSTSVPGEAAAVAVRYKAETDATNNAFDLAKKNWTPKDYIQARRVDRQLADKAYALVKTANAGADDGEPVYIYSGQKLRTKDLAKDAMRQRLSRDRKATYTYSKDFNSLTMSMVDDTKLAVLAEAESRAQFTTPSGFVYPAPRQPSEFYKHKDAPSAARCQDLHSPWIENLYHPQPLSRGGDGETSPFFNSLPSKDMVFGGTNADGSVNAEYFKSVHLVGDGLAKEMEEAKAKDQKEWMDKLVVDRDNLRFIAHGDIMGQGRARPSPLDKPCDILAGPVRSKPLRIVRAAKLPSGKAVPLQAMPVTIMDQDVYTGGAKKVIVRDKDSALFIAKNDRGDAKDFLFPSITQILVPDVNKHTTLLKPRKPLGDAEKAGLRWTNPNQDSR